MICVCGHSFSCWTVISLSVHISSIGETYVFQMTVLLPFLRNVFSIACTAQRIYAILSMQTLCTLFSTLDIMPPPPKKIRDSVFIVIGIHSLVESEPVSPSPYISPLIYFGIHTQTPVYAGFCSNHNCNPRTLTSCYFFLNYVNYLLFMLCQTKPQIIDLSCSYCVYCAILQAIT